MDAFWISLICALIGVISGLHALLLSHVLKKQGEYCNQNRDDHKQIFQKLEALPITYRTISECNDKTKECHEYRDKKLETAQKTSEELSGERRANMCRKIEALKERFDRLSNCISGYTKGECG